MFRLLMGGIFAGLLGLSGCANPARYVVRESSGGIVSVPNNSNAWPSYNRRHAEELMAQHYPNGYEVIREEETVVGQVTTNNTQTNHETKPTPSPFLAKEETQTRETTSTQDRTEWRIYYRPKPTSWTESPVGTAANQKDSAILPTGGTGGPRYDNLNSPPSLRGDMLPGSGSVKPTVNFGR